MEMTQEEFDARFRETLDGVIEDMALDAEVEPQKFFGVTLFFENLAYFSPVIFGLIENSKKS